MDLEPLAKRFPKDWVTRDEAVNLLVSLLRAHPSDRGLGQGALHSLEQFGLVEREGDKFRRADVKRKPAPLETPVERMVRETETRFVPFDTGEPEHLLEVKVGGGVLPGCIGFTTRPRPIP